MQVEFSSGTYISGVLLKKQPYRPSQSIVGNAIKVIGTYFVKYLSGVKMELRLGTYSIPLTTDRHGGFEYFLIKVTQYHEGVKISACKKSRRGCFQRLEPCV